MQNIKRTCLVFNGFATIGQDYKFTYFFSLKKKKKRNEFQYKVQLEDKRTDNYFITDNRKNDLTEKIKKNVDFNFLL